MNRLLVVLVSSALQAAPAVDPTVQLVEARLVSLAKSKPRDIPIRYSFMFRSHRNGQEMNPFKGSGVMHVGRSGQDYLWSGVPNDIAMFTFGENVPPEGTRWLAEQTSPLRMASFSASGEYLLSMVRNLPLKAVEIPGAGVESPDGRLLVFRLEAPRPNAKLWRFKSKTGEARLLIRKDGTPVSLHLAQAYEGRLNPHFGLYTLNRTEELTFRVDDQGLWATRLRLHLDRSDWKDGLTADLDVTRGDAP